MIIRSVKLEHFRNHVKVPFEFDEKLTIIHGPNGIGKTNILESISIFSLAKSPMAIVERDMIAFSQNYARVVGDFGNNVKREYTISRIDNSNRVKKTFKLNGVLKKTVNFIDGFNSVLFEPADIKLTSGSPSRRRDFLDKLLIQTNIRYREAISKYTRSLKNRNKLLEKMFNIPNGLYPAELEVWDNNVVDAGMIIQKTRKDFFDFVETKIDIISSELFPSGTAIQLKYFPKLISRELLQERLHLDLRKATTSIGPHLDDFSVYLNNMELRNYGSRGQKRMTVLLLKLLSLEYIKERNGSDPILLLDDIFSEFDSNYRFAVDKIIKNQQTIITTANLDDVPVEIRHGAQVISI